MKNYVLQRGMVIAINKSEHFFDLRKTNKKKMRIPLRPPHRETVMRAFADFPNSRIAIIRKITSKKRMNFDDFDVIAIDPLDIRARLEELCALRDGWLEGRGVAISSEKVQWLTHMFDTIYPRELPLPHLYPTAEGGVRAEWSIQRWDLSLEIDLSTKAGYWHALELDTDEEDEAELSLATSLGWHDLTTRLTRVVPAPHLRPVGTP